MKIKKEDQCKIGLVDDHDLLREGLASLINRSHEFRVVLQAENGIDLQNKLAQPDVEIPDIILLDVTMPEMDGFATAEWLKLQHKSIKVIALSVNDGEFAIIKMIRNGARGYLLKNVQKEVLLDALRQVMKLGYYQNELTKRELITPNNKDGYFDIHTAISDISQREIEYLGYIATDMSHKDIGEAMQLSTRTIDGYRDSLFIKLNVKTRVSLVVFAINNGLIKFK